MAECVDVVLVGDGAALRSVARELTRTGRTSVVLEPGVVVRPCCGSWEVEARGTFWFAREVVAADVAQDPRQLVVAIGAALDRRRPGLG